MKRFKLFIKLKFLLLVLVLNVNSHACEENSQALTDIVSDLCYECIFPITISGITLITVQKTGTFEHSFRKHLNSVYTFI